MKNILSLISCFIICAVLVTYRLVNITPEQPLKVTYWDANGYYLYLPSILIYHDCRQLAWADSVDHEYQVTGGNGIQAQKADNGNYTFKYLGGVALMELPFFYAGHFIAQHSHYPPDGFSPPYQYALGFGIILYSFIALLVLRRVLLYYFSDAVTTITLLLTALATNYIQYAAVDNGQSHAYIFLLYALVLYATLLWHRKPTLASAIAIGYLCGLATISRPTEAIIIFIPIMWGMQSAGEKQAKWQLVKQHKLHVLFAALAGIIGILPQLIYWKYTTGSFVYDVGSKWVFLNPWFRVLFGFEKGWFIYTPVTVLFIAGMFFMRGYPFQRSVLWFGLLNIYIIIAWDDWRYGGTYSTRALVQSYPVLALAMAAFVHYVINTKAKWLFATLSPYLTGVNFFQLWQYNQTVLHFNDMNRRYYGRIYLNAHPTPVDMSVLDSNDVLDNTRSYTQQQILALDNIPLHTRADSAAILAYKADISATGTDNWLKTEASINTDNIWMAYLNLSLNTGDTVLHRRVRLFNALCKAGQDNNYAFWLHVPAGVKHATLRVSITSDGTTGRVNWLKIKRYSK
jgi:hypothetical protein